MEFIIKFDTNEQAEELHKRLINRSNKSNGAVDVKKNSEQETMQNNDGLVPLKPIGG